MIGPAKINHVNAKNANFSSLFSVITYHYLNELSSTMTQCNL